MDEGEVSWDDNEIILVPLTRKQIEEIQMDLSLYWTSYYCGPNDDWRLYNEVQDILRKALGE